MKLFNRTLELVGEPPNSRKVWLYLDEMEGSFVFEMWWIAGFAVENLDTFMERDTLPEGLRDRLLENRRSALHDYTQGRRELAEAKLDALEYKCRYHGLRIGMNPLVRKIRKAENDGRAAGIKSGQARPSLLSSIDLRQMKAGMLDDGVDERKIASRLAEKYGCTPDYVRKCLKKRD